MADHRLRASAIPLNRPSTRQPPEFSFEFREHINVICASLTVGGAERVVLDLLHGLARLSITANLFLLNEACTSYEADLPENVRLYRLGSLPRSERMRHIALGVLASPVRHVFSHLVRAGDLATLWRYGIQTIPVIHNSQPGWHDHPGTYSASWTPFLVAVSEDVARQLKLAGCILPVRVIRHEITRLSWPNASVSRMMIRKRHAIRESAILIGMVGQFKAHKAYTRAVRVLQMLRHRGLPARLMILGGWDHSYGQGRAAYAAVCRTAVNCGVSADLLCPGTVNPVDPYYSAFDVFLNTSEYEGLSIATMEAVRAGCPVVSADVGGQREITNESDVLIADIANTEAYADAIEALCRRGRRAQVGQVPRPELIPRLWTWTGMHGATRLANGAGAVLFVTSNLNPGGAQRSLVNLLTHLPHKHLFYLCVLGKVHGDFFREQLERAGVSVFSFAHLTSMLERVGQILAARERLGCHTICFWNLDPLVKLLLVKVLGGSEVRLIDVSPGPMLDKELGQAQSFANRISFSVEQYRSGLSMAVSKFHDAVQEGRQHTVIPNGVPLCETRPSGEAKVRPTAFDPSFAVVTCCRIVPNKRLEELLDVARELRWRVPRASLTIIGGVDQRHLGYWGRLQEKCKAEQLDHVHFAGPRHDVFSFLAEFRVFAMLSWEQGCPNASLEAMAAGLPVVANDDGGTAQQLTNFFNGFIVSGDDPVEMADRIAALLLNPQLADEFGRNGRRRVREEFSMEKMVQAYASLLWPS